MRALLIFTIFSLYSSSLLALDVDNVFPELFRGVWDVSLEACDHEWSDARLRVDRTTIVYWESSGQITEIHYAHESELRVKLKMTGEGEEWEKVALYKLTEYSSVITEYFDYYPSFTRVRCGTTHN